MSIWTKIHMSSLPVIVQLLTRTLQMLTINNRNTVKPVFRGHPREGKNWLFQTGDPLIQVHFNVIWFKGPSKCGCLWQVIPL